MPIEEQQQQPSTTNNHPYGILCDIDGVLIKDGQPIPFAKQAIESWQLNPRSRLLFVTNASGVREHEKAIKTNQQLHISIDSTLAIQPQQMIVAQTPMRSLANQMTHSGVLFRDRRILFVARDEDSMEKMLIEDYGFRNVVKFSDFASEHAFLLPYTHSTHENFLSNQDTSHKERIHAIFVLDFPKCWDDTIQVLIDLLLSDGRVGQQQQEQQQQIVQLYFANPDFVYAGNYKYPRFTQGAFRDCLKMLYTKMTGGKRELIYTEYGKPYPSTYDYARRYLSSHNGSSGNGSSVNNTDNNENNDASQNSCKTIYAIGDNPHSDICGANASGDEFFSILVRTGVFNDTQLDNCEEHPAKFVCDSIAEAFEFIESRERETGSSQHTNN